MSFRPPPPSPLARACLLAAVALSGAACQHAPATRGGAPCESFAEFDATTRRQLDALLTEAPGDQLVSEASRLNRERRACAKHVLATLPRRREDSGIEAVQREIDALVATYRPDDLDAMLADALGEDAQSLRPYLAEARSRLERERRAGAASRRDDRAAHQPGTDTAALDAFARHQGHADRDASRVLGAIDEERARADREAKSGVGALDREHARADHDAKSGVGAIDRERARADHDATSGLGALDRARARADHDASRWVTGSAASDLPPLRPADDATAEALRSLGGASRDAGPCAASHACVRLTCDTLEARDADALARRCLDDGAARPHEERARQVAAVLTRLLDFPPLPARTEAFSALETLRRQDWPGIEATARQGRAGLAAQRASPFLALDGARAEVQRLRDAGQARHLQRARALASTPLAAWLHAKVAEELGGPVAPPPPGKGRWGPPRWRCAHPAPERLPPLPAGLEATLHAACAEPSRAREGSELRTFDLDVGGQRVEGSLVAACAGKSHALAFRLEEPGVSGFPAAAFDAELQRLAGEAAKTCRELHARAALAECAGMQARPPAEVARSATLHALATGAWAPCFREWLETTEGVAPPQLE